MSYGQQSHTLVLSKEYEVHRILPWQKAYSLVFSGKAEELVSYDADAKTVNFTFKIPAVVRLLKSIPRKKKAVRFSRANIWLRDKQKCAYCAKKLTLRMVTYDHIIPRSRWDVTKHGPATTWLNIISACLDCNLKKRNRTPEEAGMKLLVQPYKPVSLPLVLSLDLGKNIPDAWRDFVYWHGELEQD